MINILAIESSCDETSASVISNGKVLNNVIATQSIHEIYGGVVPELASRAHMQKIVPIVKHALEDSGIEKSELSAIAYTKGPGLLGSLLVGASFAKSMALTLGIPLIGVNHMHAHILAHFIDEPRPEFPFLCLTVSGGHTQLVIIKSAVNMEVIGETRDDAVGEAFDKCAKMLKLPYPGGPMVSLHAEKGDPHKYSFGKTSMPGLEFSFSGIKTGFLYFLQDGIKQDPDFVHNNMNDLCASLQFQLVNMLMEKLDKAIGQTGISQVAIAGGVSANTLLRSSLEQMSKDKGIDVFIPDFQYCTDNAGMVAMTAHFLYQEGKFEDLTAIPEARLAFNS